MLVGTGAQYVTTDSFRATPGAASPEFGGPPADMARNRSRSRSDTPTAQNVDTVSSAHHAASPLSSPRLRARSLALMFVAAGAVGMFAAFFPAENARPLHIDGHSTIFLIPAVSLVTAAVAWLTAERWPAWLWLAVPGATNLLVGMAIYNAGTIPSGAEIFLMWTLVFAAFFLPTRHAVVLGVEAGVVLAVVIAIGPATVKPVTLWVMLMGSFVGVAAVVAVLKRHLETALGQVHDEAMTDPLTGLGNRRRLMEDLRGLLAGDVPAGGGIAMFDLDGFKAFNDAFGHPAGDALLGRLGRRLQQTCEGIGCAYRLGGDEFCVVLAPRAADLQQTAERARLALTEHGPGYEVGASCGWVEVARERDLVETLREVDARLYSDKWRRTAGQRSATVLRAAQR